MSRPHLVTCDQMIWLKNALDRYKARVEYNANSPRIADAYHATDQAACMIEIMEVLCVQCEDARAVGNVLASVKAAVPRPKTDTNIPTANPTKGWTHEHDEKDPHCNCPQCR